MVQIDLAPDLWRELMDASLAAAANGADVWPQVAGRATGLLSGLHTTYSTLDVVPAFRALKDRGLVGDELVAALRDPEARRAIVEWEPSPADAARLAGAGERTYILGDPPLYEPGPERSLARAAQDTGRSIIEVALDAMLESGGDGVVYMPILNYATGSLEPTREMLLHPRAALGLSDGGAHCGFICDASIPTFMLTHWTRDRANGERLPLEWTVKKQTHDTARLYGMGDRGTLEVGMLGDVNVIDYDRLQLGVPKMHFDLPAGGRRLLQPASGYVATVKSGLTTFVDGEDTGVRPGRLVRGAR
jgi:N-acyl-D-aspartate/D-glutamate deacylase